MMSDYIYDRIKEKLENDISKLDISLNKLKIYELDSFKNFIDDNKLSVEKIESADYTQIANLVDEISTLYTSENDESSRSRYIEEIESLLNIISLLTAKKIINDSKKEEFWGTISIINNIVDMSVIIVTKNYKGFIIIEICILLFLQKH